MATVEERFQAAVNVIKGLPKNGPYQPTTAMMLKFYGYYKQATEGPCSQKKPAFWDIVGKAKWDAWNSNRHLTQEQAMKKYVDDLREIIETMSFTTDVADFVGSVSGLDNINLDELEMIAPGMREIAESHPNSPFNSRTNSPQHGTSANSVVMDEISTTSAAGPLLNGHYKGVEKTHENGDIDSEPEVSIQAAPLQQTSMIPINGYAVSNGTVEQSDDEYGDPIDMQHDLTEAVLRNAELLKQIQATVLRMNADLVAVNQRMSTLEKTVKDVRLAVQQRSLHASSSSSSRTRRNAPKWWPFDDISPAWFIFLILWPFVVRRLSNLTHRKN